MSQPIGRLYSEVRANEQLPELTIELTPTRIVATAIATRDYQPVHHDIDIAQGFGNAGIFLNTHTTAGILERFVLEWAGPGAFVKSVKFRLGIPGYAGDTLVLRGEVAEMNEDERLVSVKVVGTNALGTHVDGVVVIELANA